MPSIINSDDGVVSGTSGLKTTGGNDGLLNIQSNGSTVVAVTGSGISVTGTVSQTGVSTFAAGTVSAPSITFTGDTNTGIFSPAADTIAFAEGGAEAMRIDSSGRLLLNTTSELTNIYFEASNITPTTQFLTNQTGSYSGGLALLNYSAGGFGSVLTIGSSRSDTKGTNTTTSAGTPVAQLNFVGNDGTNFRTTAAIKVAIDGVSGSGDMPGRLEFYTTADGAATSTERARIPAAGGFQCVNSISVGNATPTTSGAGITFPATQSASTDANTLDDYEEGTWTASVGGNATYNDQTCYYTKIGKVVYVCGTISINSIGTGSASTISGLPFTSSNGFSSGAATYYSGISSSAYNNPIPTLTSGSTTSFGFSWNTAGATTTSQLRGNLFQNSSRIDFGFFYFAS